MVTDANALLALEEIHTSNMAAKVHLSLSRPCLSPFLYVKYLYTIQSCKNRIYFEIMRLNLYLNRYITLKDLDWFDGNSTTKFVVNINFIYQLLKMENNSIDYIGEQLCSSFINPTVVPYYDLLTCRYQ